MGRKGRMGRMGRIGWMVAGAIVTMYPVIGHAAFAVSQSPQPSSPVIVKSVEPDKKDPTGLADVLIGALGLTGVMVLLAIIAAAIFGAILFWVRSRKPYDHAG